MMQMVPRIDIDSVVQLINEFASATRAEAGESGSTYQQVASLTGLEASQEEAVAVADSLFATLRLTVHRDNQEFVQALNKLIADAELSYRLDDAEHLVWAQPDSGHLLLGSAVASLAHFVSDSGIGRIGFCSATRCVDVYADHSRGGQRQYCSDGCGARSRVARWRQQSRLDEGDLSRRE